MKLNKSFLLIFQLFIVAAFAQQASLQMVANEEFTDRDNFILNLEFDVSSSVQSGFVLKFPENIKITPAAVFLTDEALWLKKSDKVPELPGTVHWNDGPDGIYFIFPAGYITGLGKLRIQLNSFSPMREKVSSVLTLHSLSQAGTQNSQAGLELSRVVLFQDDNTEIR